jgi:hypothetical protein
VLVQSGSARYYRVGVERSARRTRLDLDEAYGEVQARWFVWTAAGLTVHPATWTDRGLGLRVTRPNAEADIVVQSDGWAETAVRRPDAAVAVRATAQIESLEAFGLLLDRVVELITRSGVRKDRPPSPENCRTQRAGHWVLGFDGLPPSANR